MRCFWAKWFWRLCICGLLGSLLIWVLPNGLKIYHIHRREVDYKILFAQYGTEYGLAPNGIVFAHHVLAFDSSALGNTVKELNPIREDWFKNGLHSKKPWPTNSNRLEWDEWGPSQWHTAGDVKVTQVGAVFCLPYSMIAIFCALPLVLRAAFFFRRGRRRTFTDATAAEGA